MKILNFGSCNIDYVYSLDHIVIEGETETSSGMNVFSGGKGLNQSVAAARAGAEVYHAGCLGEDGGFLADEMKESGVDISLINHVKEKNGHAIIQVDAKGKNSIFLYAGSNGCITRNYVDSVIERFDEGDILILQNEINEIPYIVDKAFEKGMRIMLNPSPCNDKIKEIDFSKLAYIVLNQVEAAEITGTENDEQAMEILIKKYPGINVLLTLGSKGCIYSGKEGKLFQPAFKVPVVDTTAAGDTFTGYFAAGIIKGDDMETILKTATAASALAVSRKGAAPSVPYADEVKKALEEFIR
ncbi:MAG: ribokinase [Clostridia bacterium]|nr:ribokinase [Clostridia bacterium]